MDQEVRLHGMLVALGPGGTRELAERALVHADAVLVARPAYDRLGGLAEVARLCDRHRSAIGNWLATASNPTPEPEFRVDATPIWDLAKWRDYGRAYPDRMGPAFDPFAID